MTKRSTPNRTSGATPRALKSLVLALGLTTLAAAGASAAQDGTEHRHGQSQQMQQEMPAGPSFESMRETMQNAREADDPAERRQHMHQHMQMMNEKMQAMHGMMDQMPMQGMGGDQSSNGMAMGTSEQMHQMMHQMMMHHAMGHGMPMMERMREHQVMMQQMMEQMLEQQRMMIEMDDEPEQ